MAATNPTAGKIDRGQKIFPEAPRKPVRPAITHRKTGNAYYFR
jgi:hypothetical protein